MQVGGRGGDRSDGGGSRLLWDSLRPVMMGNVQKADSSAGTRCPEPHDGPQARGAHSVRRVGSRHWSLGVSSFRKPKADGDSLKCLQLRRQRQGGFWSILVGPGRVEKSGNLSPKLSHQHVLAEWQEWLFARAMFGKAALYIVFPVTWGIQIFTYTTIHIGMSEGK